MADDKIDLHKKRDLAALGGKTGVIASAADKGALAESLVVLAPPEELPPDHGVKDSERLKIIARTLNAATVEQRWFATFSAKLALQAAVAARKVGFGPWRKRHASEEAIAREVCETFSPVLHKLTGAAVFGALPGLLTQGVEPGRFSVAFVDLPGAPPLHPSYVADPGAFELVVNQEDTKHVAHAFMMLAGHAWIRAEVCAAREGAGLVLPRELVKLFEVNLCQHYVPSTMAAYFEGQPMRAFARELGNRLRKVAFGGQ